MVHLVAIVGARTNCNNQQQEGHEEEDHLIEICAPPANVDDACIATL